MELRTLSALAFVALLHGCASGNSPGCIGHNMDFSWVPFSARDIVADVTVVNERFGGISEAINLLGVPVKSGESKALWIYGRHKEGRKCLSNGLYDSTYLVRYAILELQFSGDSLEGCSVTERTFIDATARPDPFGRNPISSRSLSCTEFLRSSQEEHSESSLINDEVPNLQQ